MLDNTGMSGKKQTIKKRNRRRLSREEAQRMQALSRIKPELRFKVLSNIHKFKEGNFESGFWNSDSSQIFYLKILLERADNKITYTGYVWSDMRKRINKVTRIEFYDYWKGVISRIEKKCWSWDVLKQVRELIKICPVCGIPSYFTEDFCSRCTAKISFHTPGRIARRCREKYPFELKGVQEVELLSAQINTANQIMEEAEL